MPIPSNIDYYQNTQGTLLPAISAPVTVPYVPTPQQLALAQAQAIAQRNPQPTVHYTPAQVQQRLLQQQNQQIAAQHQAQLVAQQQQDELYALQRRRQAQISKANLTGTGPHGLIPVGSGDEEFRSAKRRKPTDRSLPSFKTQGIVPVVGATASKLESSTKILESLSSSYSRLQAIEKKLDWEVSRKRVEINDILCNGKNVGTRQMLRIHLSTKLIDQPWQLPLARLIPPSLDGTSAAPKTTATSNEASENPLSDGEKHDKDEDAMEVSQSSMDSSALSSDSINFETNEGLPKVELSISAEILNDKHSPARSFSQFIKRVVVDTNRDPVLHPKTGPKDWRRPDSQATSIPGLNLTIPLSTPAHIRISLYLDQQPEVFSLAPDLVSILHFVEGDRITVLQALWSYIRKNGLQDDDKKHIKVDQRMKKLFAGQDKVPFHHIPEYINRFLAPALPIQLELSVKVDEASGELNHVAYDLPFHAEDRTQVEMDKVVESFKAPAKALEDLMKLDEEMAESSLLIKSTLQKRTALSAFASSPAAVLNAYLRSQSEDMRITLGEERGTEATSTSSWRETIRRSEVWGNNWVGNAVTVHSGRLDEGPRESSSRSMMD